MWEIDCVGNNLFKQNSTCDNADSSVSLAQMI